MNTLESIVVEDKITANQFKLIDVINNKLPIAVENLDFSHIDFPDSRIPDLSFMEVENNFDCSNTNIISFEGFPDVKGSLDISNTSIDNLKGCPESVKEIEMSYTNISSFENCPENVEIIDAWKTEVSDFKYLPRTLKKLSIGRTNIRDLSKCPESIENLVADYLDISNLEILPRKIKKLSISGSLVEDFKGMPENIEEITCYHNENLKVLDGLNIRTLKGIAIMDCPGVLPEEIDVYYDIIKASTTLEKEEILEEFLKQREIIRMQKAIDHERRTHF